MAFARLTATWALAATMGVAGCGGGTDPANVGSAAGHFIGPGYREIEPEGFYLALSLRPSAGLQVTGTGWLAGADLPVIPFRVSGSYNAPGLSLALDRLDGTPYATFAGTAGSGGITGGWTRGGATVNVRLARVDTVATGTYHATLTGAAALTRTGAAGFFFERALNRTSFLLGWSAAGDPLVSITWPGPPRGRGTHDLTAPGMDAEVLVYPSGGGIRAFRVTSGSLRLDVADQYSNIGRITALAREEGGVATISLSAEFSAGCGGRPCRP